MLNKFELKIPIVSTENNNLYMVKWSTTFWYILYNISTLIYNSNMAFPENLVFKNNLTLTIIAIPPFMYKYIINYI